MRHIRRAFFFFLLACGILIFAPSLCALPAQDVKPINNREYFPAVMNCLNNAVQRIRIILYLAQRYDGFPKSPTNELFAALVKAKERGVDVAVILERPKGFDERTADLAGKNQQAMQFLAKANVPVYEDSQAITTHAKVLIVDSRYTILGSTNWTYAALARNNEAAVLIDSEAVARVYEQMFDEIKKQSEK